MHLDFENNWLEGVPKNQKITKLFYEMVIFAVFDAILESIVTK